MAFGGTHRKDGHFDLWGGAMKRRTRKVRNIVLLIVAFLALFGACVGVMSLADDGTPRTGTVVTSNTA